MSDEQTQQRQLLEPFGEKAIKQKPGGFRADFVSWTDKLQRLLAIGVQYEWEILDVTHETGDSKEPFGCHGRLTLNIDGQPRTFDGFGQGDDLKKASTDAFSRACAFAGLGLHLWCQGGDKDAGYWITGVLDAR